MKKTLITAALAATALSANAAVVVSTTRGGNGDQAGFVTNSGQTFTTGVIPTGDNFLSSIDLVGPNTGGVTDPLGPFTVKIWTDVDGDATTWDPGTVVATSTATINIPTSNGTVSALFDGTVALNDNTVYVLSFTTDEGLGTQVDHDAFRMGLTADGGAGGPLGSSGKLFDNGGDPAFGDNRELAFTVNTVPEPSSFALLGLGGLALLRRRRK